MATTDVKNGKATRTRTATPRQRKEPAAAAGHARAWKLFEARAQEWLLGQPGRIVNLPHDLAQVVKLGAPCPRCGTHVHRLREDGHTVSWQRVEQGHWASGITVECRRSPG